MLVTAQTWLVFRGSLANNCMLKLYTMQSTLQIVQPISHRFYNIFQCFIFFFQSTKSQVSPHHTCVIVSFTDLCSGQLFTLHDTVQSSTVKGRDISRLCLHVCVRSYPACQRAHHSLWSPQHRTMLTDLWSSALSSCVRGIDSHWTNWAEPRT